MQQAPIAGSILAACASLFWTLAPFLFASAVRNLGAWRVNPLRLAAAAIILSLIAGVWLLLEPSALIALKPAALWWLAVSGIIGLVIGDALYLTSLGFLGPRRTLQVLVLAPAVSAIAAWLWLDERIDSPGILGMAITLGALLAATMIEKKQEASREPGAFSWTGLLIAVAATVCHGGAAVLTRKAYLMDAGLNPMLATAARMLSSAVAIWVIVLARGQARGVLDGLKNRKALGRLGAATLFGPVLGMICYVSAFKTAPAGIVSLLSSLSPVLIIPISAWRYKTKINTAAFICVALALAGVLLVTL